MRAIAKASSAGSTSDSGRRVSLPMLFALSTLAFVAFLGSGAPVAGAADCPNEALRVEQGAEVLALPDCMAIEQVSPQKKDNQPARIRFANPVFPIPESGAVSLGGDRVRFITTAALGETTGNLAEFGDWYVAGRAAENSRWTTSHANPPLGMIKGWGDIPYPFVFNADLSHWFHIASTPDQFEAGLGQVLRGGPGGESMPFSSLLAPLSGTPAGHRGQVRFEPSGSSADSSHLYFSTEEPITYLPGDPLPAGSAMRNTYVASLNSGGGQSLELLARDGNGKVWGSRCGAALGGSNNFSDRVRNRGAISADGSRVYFTTRPTQPTSGSCNAANTLRILKRVETAEGPWISQLISPECNRVANLPSVPACGTVAPSGTPVPDSDEIYEGASIEGSKVYFTTGRQLTNSDVNGIEAFGSSGCVDLFEGFGLGGCDLYLFDSAKPVGQRLTQITAGSSGLSAPKVVTISGDGSHAYFTSKEVLTVTPGPEGKLPQAGQPNLYLFEQSPAHPNGRLAFVATTNPASAYPVPVLGPDPTEIGVGGDGHLLVFSSTAALTADDLDGSKSDIFCYDADTGSLTRISKAAPGGTDNGPVDVFVGSSLGQAGNDRNAPDFVVRDRWVSEDGKTISFRTQEALLAGDDNDVLDSYIFRDGQLYRLPGTADSTNGLAPGAGLQDGPLLSTDGNTIVFQSFERLLSRDGDTAADVYALRADGGFPEPPEPKVCPADSNGGCQGPAGGPIGEASGVSASFTGPGNLKPKSQRRRCPKGKRVVRRKGKVRCANRKAAKKASKAKRNRHANANRRAGK